MVNLLQQEGLAWLLWLDGKVLYKQDRGEEIS